MKYAKTKLSLPFGGSWLVSNGGLTPETNNHIRPSDQGPQNQLYAYDFRFKNTGNESKITDFPAFGKPVLAPADGKVAQIITGSYDVEYGERDRSVGVGNCIIIKHVQDEYSLICHLKHQSIKVKVGDEVRSGQPIALCGNSGNTTQPHIHFNMQNGPFMHTAKALAAKFSQILVNGKVKTNYIPIRGDLVRNELD